MISEAVKTGGATKFCTDGGSRSSKSCRPRWVDSGSRCGSDDGVDPVLVEDAQALNDPAR
jgi:hypothetical protein